jgi:iron(II)-dependent oxidoreductase
MPWNANHPVNCVDFNQAKTFCEWQGKRLPTEAEWEKAARGTDGRIFPWGNELADCTKAVMNDQPFVEGVMGPGCGSGTTQPVGSKPAGASPYGVLDMAGNLWNWTNDWYADDYFQNSPTNNPQGPSSGEYKVIKGSDWGMRVSAELASTVRFNYAPLGQGYLIGFRCAKDVN